MKYASQINIVVVIVALVAVGYAVSQTIWKLPVTPSVEAGGPASQTSPAGKAVKPRCRPK